MPSPSGEGKGGSSSTHESLTSLDDYSIKPPLGAALLDRHPLHFSTAVYKELMVDDKYLPPSAFSNGTTKKYWIPSAALTTGVITRDFKVGRVRLTKDDSKFSAATPWVEFIFQNLQQLSIAKKLLEIADPIESACCHDYAKKVFSGEFNCHYGDKSRRLFHSIIQMPKLGRANLIWRDTGNPLEYEFDIKSCHPVLLLTLMTNTEERNRYCCVLDCDIYDVIRAFDDNKDTRDGCKTEFLRFINYDKKSHSASKNNYVYQFFKNHFPFFTNDILKQKDMALYLQNLEAKIMVDELGKFCMAKNIWYVPMHDGFLCKPESLDIVAAFVTTEYYKLTQYNISITYKVINSYSNKISSSNNNYLPSSYHMWGYKTPVRDNAQWDKFFGNWKKNNPEELLEKAHAKRKKAKERFNPILKHKQRDAEDWKLFTTFYKKQMDKL